MYHPASSASFATPPILDYVYALDDNSQLQASVVLIHYGLDPDSRELLGNRWSHQWSRHSDKAKVDTQKLLYLCACGYDHHQRNTKYDRTEPHGAPGTQERHTGVPFTGCLVHAEITIRENKILRIRGHFEHNEECRTAKYTRAPPIPVHPSVYVVALAQLCDGATFSDVRRKNRDLLQAKAYADFPTDIASSPYRWVLTNNDSRSLYRQHSRLKGVSITVAPEINVDDWLNPRSDKYNATLANAIFHYSARADRGERFEVAIATDDMNRAAWRYGYSPERHFYISSNSFSFDYKRNGHESQIILDGIFGVCDSRLLLFIVMAVDENQKGVPIAFLLFSAPTGNRQSSSGYDTAILMKLLKKWSESLNKSAHLYGHAGVLFKPLSVITDTDLKQRGALVGVWSDIWLLICRFHLRQSWRNHRNRLLKGKSAVYMDLKHRMICLERALTTTQTITEARALLESERQVMVKLSAEQLKAAAKSMKHINHLDTYWTTDNLWPSWSDYGRTVLASMLGTAIDGVIPTTNHLESFNRVLKQIHLRRFQNGGCRLRVDVLIHALMIFILPSIFKERSLLSEQASRIAALVRLLPGGAALLEKKKGPKPVPAVPRVAYLLPDANRDERARDLVAHRQISVPAILPADFGMTMTCYSSRALSIDTNPKIYTIRVGFNRVVTCDCLDLMDHGGACKNIHAVLIILDDMRRRGIPIPFIPIPLSLADAQALQSMILAGTVQPNKADLPTAQAAEKIEGILLDDTCVEEDEEHDDVDDDNASVATDASSDSNSDDEDELDRTDSVRVNQNVAALGEQAVSRTMFELEEMASRLTDLGEYLDQRVTGLAPEERARVGKGYGQLAGLMAKLQRVMDLPPPSTQEPTSPTIPVQNVISPAATSVPTPPNPRKRRNLLPPSPERAQKRHQSHNIH
ncbi:hypothetical protein MVEN_01698300 [Mycena venus]|uniref:SWIM-type domain-containing protein n=1 Tax=Mycena venus TaxID=2733690 RepID=A0A8H6XP89_9AGAR|nr:hypothetical protein MVEN_01698300 [Mycena venus]